MKILFVFLVLTNFYISNLGQCVNPAQIDQNVFCPQDYTPVCGCDGITYSNSCYAINYGGVTSWTNGPCASNTDCINLAQIDSSIFCSSIYEPVCGCDSVSYQNSCFAQYYGGVTSWTNGACQTSIEIADSCTNLNGIDFGACNNFLGYGKINGICSPISGCSTIVNGIDYSEAIYNDLFTCESFCNQVQFAEACSSLDSIDFGACTTPIGFGVVNNTCQIINGCDWIINNINYSNALYSSISECQACMPSGINEAGKLLTLYPNPTKEVLNIELHSIDKIKKIRILDYTFRPALIFRDDFENNSLDVASLKPGFYFVELTFGKTIALYSFFKE